MGHYEDFLWVCAKRLEKGRFTWPQSGDAQGKVVLSHEELVSIIGWDRSGQDQTQAVVSESSARRTCCRMSWFLERFERLW